jgi:ankyrin repeat protein
MGEAYGCTPLMAAAMNGNAEIVRILLEAGADVNARMRPAGGTPGKTALLFAAQEGHTEIVDVLRKAGAEW